MDASDLPPEKKAEARGLLKGFLKVAGETIIKSFIDVGAKSLKGE